MSSVTNLPSYGFWSLHSHSRYSINDAMPAVADMVAKAADLGYPALGLTDHGSMSGVVQLYKACRKSDIEPLPGIELYVTADSEQRIQGHNMHLTVAAYTTTGYRNLVRLANLSHEKYFHKPRVDMADLATFAENGWTRGLVVSTGCYFGLVPTVLRTMGDKYAMRIAATLAGWFPRVYVELQNHGIWRPELGESDDELVTDLLYIAEKVGLPYIITQDSHYLEQAEQPIHDALKELVSFSDDPAEAVFPGDGYHMVDAAWLARYFEPEVLRTGLANLHDLAQAASVRLPELEKFSLRVPDLTHGGNPDMEIQRRVRPLVKDLSKRYQDRLDDELAIIVSSGMAGYLLLVAEVCDHMREQGIWYSARGSASNCLVNYLLKITQVDPVKWDLRMERFLSTDRTKPPDIDLDVEHARRELITNWLSERYTTVQVGTHHTYSLFDESEDEGKGSLRVQYYASLRKRGIAPPAWRDLPPEHLQMLKELGSRELLKSHSTHAAAYVVAPDAASVVELPQSYIASSKTMVTSFGKDDVETAGFVKLDLLGLRELTALRISCEAAGVVPEQIPLNDKETFSRIGAGITDAVFQLRGRAARDGCTRLKPKKIGDIVAAMALFRPASQASGATGDYLARRRGSDPIPTQHADIMAETKETYGVLLYQEQVMGVLRRIGMSAEELDPMLKAIKASNKYTAGAKAEIEARLPRIRELALARGWDNSDISWLAHALEANAEYGFNKGHAVAYGLLAYRQAYMATHHRLAFWMGALTASMEDDKESEYVTQARRSGVRILGPHVNHSGTTYAIDAERQAIRRPLNSIKGLGKGAAAELADKAPFSSLVDLGQRCPPRKVSGAKGLALHKSPEECGGVIAALHDAGALAGLSEGES